MSNRCYTRWKFRNCSNGKTVKVNLPFHNMRLTWNSRIYFRKGLGGQWRQGGLAAACCSYSIQNLDPILIDHENAKSWASDLSKAGLRVVQPKSNIVLVECNDEETAAGIVADLGEQEIYVQQAADPRFIRAVFHRSVNYSLLEKSIAKIKNAFA